VASRPGRSNLCPHDPPKCDLTASDASGVVGFGYTSIPVRSRKCGITADRAFVFVPRGRPHTFQSVVDEPARILIHFTPSGIERFFEGFAALEAPGPGAFERVGAEVGMDVVGPPLAQSDPI